MPKMRTAFLRSRAASIADGFHSALDGACLICGIAVAILLMWATKADEPFFWE